MSGIKGFAIIGHGNTNYIVLHDEDLNATFGYPRFELPSRPYVLRGIGISICVKFGDSANLPSNKLLVDLSAAGCDFVVKA